MLGVEGPHYRAPPTASVPAARSDREPDIARRTPRYQRRDRWESPDFGGRPGFWPEPAWLMIGTSERGSARMSGVPRSPTVTAGCSGASPSRRSGRALLRADVQEGDAFGDSARGGSEGATDAALNHVGHRDCESPYRSVHEELLILGRLRVRSRNSIKLGHR